MSFISEPLSVGGNKNLTLICKNGVSKKVIWLPRQLVTAVTLRCVPFTRELYIYMKVLQIFLSGHTQELHKRPPGLVGLRQ